MLARDVIRLMQEEQHSSQRWTQCCFLHCRLKGWPNPAPITHKLQSFYLAWSQETLPTQLWPRPKRWGGPWAFLEQVVSCSMVCWWCTSAVQGPAAAASALSRLPTHSLETCRMDVWRRPWWWTSMAATAPSLPPQAAGPGSGGFQPLHTPAGRSGELWGLSLLLSPLWLSFNSPPELEVSGQMLCLWQANPNGQLWGSAPVHPPTWCHGPLETPITKLLMV